MPVTIIAEAGVNHNGSLEMAKEMARVAKECGADIVKYQTAVPELVVSKFAEKAEYQKQTTDAAESQLEMIRKLHFSFEAHKELKEYCDSIGIQYLSAPFDVPSVKFLGTLGLPLLKIPSGEITNLPYLEAMAAQNQPLSIVLCANPSTTGAQTTAGRQIDLNKIPTAICESSRVSVIFGQSASEQVHRMQLRNTTKAPVGFLGAVMGAIARANVQESVAWVKQFNLFTDDFQEIELGFGDTNLDVDDAFVSVNAYESLSPTLLDELDDKGYMFPIKYAGRENGIYISRDQTCSHGDFRTIARNRTINKSRRQVRSALLPYVNSPLMVNPSTGYLASSKITAFQTLIGDILSKMQAAQEISGYSVTIDEKQNVLVDDTLRIGYTIVPVGVATRIYVEEGLSLTAK